jgi:hypothetical protein
MGFGLSLSFVWGLDLYFAWVSVSFSSVRVVLYWPFLFNVVLKSQCTEKDDKIASLMRMQVSLEVEWTKSLQAFTTNSIESNRARICM